MTDAEKAALDVLEQLRFMRQPPNRDEWEPDQVIAEDWRALMAARRALRESRKPQPKWRAMELHSVINAQDGELHVTVFRRAEYGTAEDRSRVLDLLNKADPA